MRQGSPKRATDIQGRHGTGGHVTSSTPRFATVTVPRHLAKRAEIGDRPQLARWVDIIEAGFPITPPRRGGGEAIAQAVEAVSAASRAPPRPTRRR